MTAQHLKNSILQLAVQGKLVPQDPDDESASALLERIRTMKQSLVKEGKIKKEKSLSPIAEEEFPFDVPDSWEWVRLGNLVYNHGQLTPKADFCYIDIGSINNQRQLLNEQETILSADKAPSRARKIVMIGDILYSTVRPYLHNMCIIDREFSLTPIASTGFAVMTCYQGLYNRYLFYYLLSPNFDNYANHTDNSKGVAYPAINDKRLYNALVPLPPLSEQHRIVKRIEQLLPHVADYDTAEQKLTALNAKFPEQLKKSILQSAVHGKLVPQDENDEPASALLECIRAEKEQLTKDGKIKREKPLPPITDDEIPFDLPDSWIWVRLGTLLNKITDGTHHTPKYSESGVPFLSVKDISSGKINFDNTKFISEEEHAELYKRCDPEKGDVLLTKVGTTGIPVLIDTDKEFSLFVSVALLKFNQDLLYGKYLVKLLESPLVRLQCTENTRGVGNKNWVIRDIANTLVVLPPLAEQYRIAARCEELMTMVKWLR